MRAADYKFVQYHNQSAASTLHKNLVAMWDAIHAETNGRVDAVVYAENNKLAAGDPAALKMLIDGEIQFFTLMGGIIGTVVPMAEVQQAPFAFKSTAEAFEASTDRSAPIWARRWRRRACIFPDRRVRQRHAPSHHCGAAGFQARRPRRREIRVPPGQMIFDTFQAFGAEPVTTSANLIYDSLKTGKVGAQENPLAILENFKIYEVIKYVSMTNHMWSGFNEMAHLATWQRLPADVKDAITRNVTKSVRAQRIAQNAVNDGLRQRLASGGSPSTRSIRRRSAPSSVQSMRPGRTSSAPSAGRSWRQRRGSWGNTTCRTERPPLRSCDAGTAPTAAWPPHRAGRSYSQ